MNVPKSTRPLVVAAVVLGGTVALVVGLMMTSRATADPVTFPPAPVVLLASQPPARLVVDAPLPEPLARGLVVVRYHAENLRVVPVYGPAALAVSPRVGHLHVTLDDAPWHWVDASGEPLTIQGLPPGPHKMLVELADPTHRVIDSATIEFEIPLRPKHL
jgi:Family of unknown function (DUF6130)